LTHTNLEARPLAYKCSYHW